MKKILTIVGARPQFIKAALVSRALESSTLLEESIVHTGQHYDSNMSDVFFEEMGLKEPEYNLAVGSMSHVQQTAIMMSKLEQVYASEKPCAVLVYGDTNSTLAGALTAAQMRIPVVHVEAGLRSYDMTMPEEINRRLTDQLSDILFTPTENASSNLSMEGIANDVIFNTGDVMYDTTVYYTGIALKNRGIMDRLGIASGNYVLATIHRQENTDIRINIESIARGLEKMAERVKVVLPMHPRTLKMLAAFGIQLSHENIIVIEPISYLDMLLLESQACLCLTDSGGVQKEAFFHKVPCITVRNTTEWVELVECGWNRLVPAAQFAEEDIDVFDYVNIVKNNVRDEAIFGDGHASLLIVSILEKLLI